MCGIAGVVEFSGKQIAPAVMEQVCERLRHRGPDCTACWHGTGGSPAVALAHARLAVIDPRPQSRQPLQDVSGRYVISYNGMIYNYEELREALLQEGRSFRTQSDSEVLLNAYAHWGTDALDRLQGMWAFCIYDEQERAGILCRDRFGIKPLYYALADGQLAFASEMPALQALSAAPRVLAEDSLKHYLTFGYIPHPDTIYRHYYKLAPGHVLHFDRHGAQSPRRYYALPRVQPAPAPDYDVAGKILRSRILASVRARTVADVPLGAFLSGGLDSSIVVAHLAADLGLSVKSFSLGYKNEPRYDETRFARAAARHFGTEHHEFRVGFDDILEALPRMLDHLGEPFADASLIPTSILSKLTRGSVTVALSGDGADELFGGYFRYAAHHYDRRYRRLPAVLRRALIEPLLKHLPAARSSVVADRVRQMRKLLRADSADALQRHVAWSSILSPDAGRRLFSAGDDYSPGLFIERFRLAGGLQPPLTDDPLNQILRIDLNYQLPSDMLHKVDLASMAHGLEVRVPFLDAAVVEYACDLPAAFKVHKAMGKRILRDAYGDLLPPEVLDRRKMGFELPIGEFLRRELKEMFMDTVRKDVVHSLPGLSYDGILELYEDHYDRREDHADILYALLVLCWWKQKH